MITRYPSISPPRRALPSATDSTDTEHNEASGRESNTPPSMDTENEISLHYARMMRKLDYDHRKALHLKDKELAETRERLHEKDMVLRQQLRGKDFLIDDLKQRLANLEGNMEVALEKARNEVEDLWESRWKDRDFHLRERMRRIEEDAMKTIEAMSLPEVTKSEEKAQALPMGRCQAWLSSQRPGSTS
jgi:hypothetical protein